LELSRAEIGLLELGKAHAMKIAKRNEDQPIENK
jgi:hypothetical protein